MASSGNLYTDLSHYYDQFCADIDYPQHSEFAERAYACFAPTGRRRYLDLACGTGHLLQLMANRGFEVTGLDNSEAMLASAALRCPSASLVKEDIAAFDLPDNFDLITCLLYSIHYSHPVNALRETLQRAFSALTLGGVFIFDLVDKMGIGQNDVVSTYTEIDDTRLTFRSGWRYPTAGETLELHLSIACKQGDDYRCWDDQHIMTAITIDAVRKMMIETGFEVTILEHDFSTLREWNSDNFNAIFIGCKPLSKG